MVTKSTDTSAARSSARSSSGTRGRSGPFPRVRTDESALTPTTTTGGRPSVPDWARQVSSRRACPTCRRSKTPLVRTMRRPSARACPRALMSASRVTTWPIMVIPGTFVRRCPLPPHPSLRSSTPPHPTPSPPYLYARSSQGPPDLYVRCAHEARRPRSIYASLPAPSPPHLIYMRFAWPHPEGITPECRSVGEVELRFRGTIRPERPHRLSDPPPRQPHPSLSACPPITPYFYTLRWASLRSPTPPLPVAPIIYMLAALTRAGFICSLLTKAHRP